MQTDNALDPCLVFPAFTRLGRCHSQLFLAQQSRAGIVRTYSKRKQHRRCQMADEDTQKQCLLYTRLRYAPFRPATYNVPPALGTLHPGPRAMLPGGHGKTAQSEIAPKGVAAAGSAHASSLAQPSSLSALADFLRSSLATRAAEAEEQSGVRRPLRRQWRSCAGRPLMHRVAAAAAPTAAAGPWAAAAAGRACPGHARNLRVTSSSGLDVSWQCKAHALASGSVC